MARTGSLDLSTVLNDEKAENRERHAINAPQHHIHTTYNITVLDKDEMGTARDDMEKARTAVVQIEKEINTIKNAVRELSMTQEKESSKVQIKMIGAANLTSKTLTLDCSSPVESKELEMDSTIDFMDVDLSVATITLKVDGLESDCVDLGGYCKFQMDLGTLECSNLKQEMSVVIKPTTADTNEAVEESKEEDVKEVTNTSTETEAEAAEDNDRVNKDEEPGTEAEPLKEQEGEPKMEEAAESTPTDNAETSGDVVTVSLEISFEPGTKDKVEKSYELLNEASKRKTEALGQLRSAAASISKEEQIKAVDGPSQKAVKPGFLNKKSGKGSAVKPVGFFTTMYNRVSKPIVTAGTLVLVFRNYIIFFGSVGLMHFQGHQLALPPPV